MSGALETTPQDRGEDSTDFGNWPKTPEDGLQRWVYFEPGQYVAVHAPDSVTITDTMRESLEDMTFPVAIIPRMIKKREGKHEPVMLGIDTEAIAEHLTAFGNGHAHISKEWKVKASRIYVAAQNIVGLMVFDAEAGIIPIPED